MQLFPHIIKYKFTKLFYIYIQLYLIKYKTNVIFYILNYANLNKIDLTDRAMVKENGIYTHTHIYIYIYKTHVNDFNSNKIYYNNICSNK